MAVDTTDVSLSYGGVTTGAAIGVNIQAFTVDTISMTYCLAKLPAVQGTDYTISIDPTTFLPTVTPTASLIAKIAAQIAAVVGEVNTITVTRTLPLVSDLTEPDSFLRQKIADQFDKDIMMIQQIDANNTAANEATLAYVQSILDAETISETIATQAQAEQGSNNTQQMTPLRTAQAISAQVGYYDVDSFSDQSGTAANDDAAVTLALAACKANPHRSIRFTRNFQLLTEKLIDFACHIEFAGVNSLILPAAAMRSCFNITASRVIIDGAYGQNNAFNLATSFIRVAKPFDSLPCTLRNLEFSGFTNGILWADGDVPHIDNIRAINNTIAIKFANNGMNGYVRGLTVLAGAALYIAKDGSVSVPQQMEGTTFHDINALITDAVNSVSTTWGIQIYAGLALRFYGTLIDQVWHAGALLIQGTALVPVNDVQFHGLWCGAAPTVDASITGVVISQAAQSIKIFGGQVQQFDGFGVFLAGTSTLQVSDFGMYGVEINGVSAETADFGAQYATGTLVDNKFMNAVSGHGVDEVTNTELMGFGNFFATGPQVVGAISQWLMNRGPGASRGLPLGTSQPGGLNAGKLWVDSTGGLNIVKAV